MSNNRMNGYLSEHSDVKREIGSFRKEFDNKMSTLDKKIADLEAEIDSCRATMDSLLDQAAAVLDQAAAVIGGGIMENNNNISKVLNGQIMRGTSLYLMRAERARNITPASEMTGSKKNVSSHDPRP